MNRNRWFIAAALVGALLGCRSFGKKKTDDSPPATATTTVAPAATPAPTPSATAAAATAPQIDEATIPAPQDFEDDAFDKVTKKNFKTELTRLEKEIKAP